MTRDASPIQTETTTNEAITETLNEEISSRKHDRIPDMEKDPTASEPLAFANTIPRTPNGSRVTLVKRGRKYELSYDRWYRNDLMLLVGYLEFFNALDFPANVWNDMPIPTFAKALMITGGTVIILASTLAAVDLHRSLRNIRKLQKERKYLFEKLQQDRTAGLSIVHWEAWLGLNFREIGWEIFDRLLMDLLVGFSSILVGPGTIMAIAGANPRIFLASNLMSGYVGNSFVALYGLINSFWATYLFVRATRHKALVLHYIEDSSLRRRANTVFTRHQIYAALNGMTLLISGTGSLISATMWWGYVVLIPCIVSSVYCNILWRKSIGYDRQLFPDVQESAKMILERVQNSVAFQQQASSEAFNKMSHQALLSLIEDHNVMGAVAVSLMNKDSARQRLTRGTPESVDVDSSMLVALEQADLARTLQTCVNEVRHRGTLDEERFLFEVLGSMLSVGGRQNSKAQ